MVRWGNPNADPLTDVAAMSRRFREEHDECNKYVILAERSAPTAAEAALPIDVINRILDFGNSPRLRAILTGWMGPRGSAIRSDYRRRRR
jgi:hypothetical protein